MFTTRIIPLVFAAAVLTGGTASAQHRPTGRPSYPPVTQRYVPPTAFVQPRVFVPPQVVGTPIYAPPVNTYRHYQPHYPFPQVYVPQYRSAFVPPFWGGLWGNYPVYTGYPVYGLPLPNFWFGW